MGVELPLHAHAAGKTHDGVAVFGIVSLLVHVGAGVQAGDKQLRREPPLCLKVFCLPVLFQLENGRSAFVLDRSPNSNVSDVASFREQGFHAVLACHHEKLTLGSIDARRLGPGDLLSSFLLGHFGGGLEVP